MKVMCYALFACAFNLLLGFTGLLSFGHAALPGQRRRGRPCAQVWGLPTELGLLFGVGVAALLAWRWARWPFAAAASTSP